MYFKSFLKIFKAQIPTLVVYLGIFLGIAAINMGIKDDGGDTGYENTNMSIAIIDKDKSELSDAIQKYLSSANLQVKEIINTEEGMEEALFQRIVEYIIIIPENYEIGILNGEDVLLESKKVPDAYSAVYVENIMNQYMSTFNAYRKSAGDNVDIHELIKQTDNAMNNSVNVTLKKAEVSDMEKYWASCFNFGAYIVLVCVMWGVAEILSVFFKKNIENRIDMSPVSSLKRNLMLVGYCLFYTVITWLLIVLIFALIFRSDLLKTQNIIRCINMLCLSLVGLAAGFLVSTLVQSKNGRNAVVNTVALGCSFISGAFISIDYISDEIVKLSSFLPVYWFTKANSYAGEVAGRALREYGDAYKCMGIQLLFFAAIISIGLVIKRQKKDQAGQA